MHEESRQELRRELAHSGALAPEWADAFDSVDRAAFLPDLMWVDDEEGESRPYDRRTDPAQWRGQVYRDVPIVTQWDDRSADDASPGERPSCSSSMPTMVCSMLAALGVAPGMRVLEIGTGTGWNAALLSTRLGAENIVTVDVDATLAGSARERLHAQGLRPTVIAADGADGWAGGAPYDRLLATCSVSRMPSAWIEQVRPGGIIMAPWQPRFGGEAFARLTVRSDGTASGRFAGSSAFMALRSQRKVRIPHERYLPDGWPGNAAPSTTELSPDAVVHDWLAQFAIGVQLPGVYWNSELYADGAYTFWLYDTAVTSWASVDYVPDGSTFAVHQSGARQLWDEVHHAWQWWDGLGRPDFDRFGLTLDDGTHTLWLDEPTHVLSST